MITLQQLKRAREYLPLIGRPYRALREKRRQVQDLFVELARCQLQIGLVTTERDEALKRTRTNPGVWMCSRHKET
jgi:hypothetical protein